MSGSVSLIDAVFLGDEGMESCGGLFSYFLGVSNN